MYLRALLYLVSKASTADWEYYVTFALVVTWRGSLSLLARFFPFHHRSRKRRFRLHRSERRIEYISCSNRNLTRLGALLFTGCHRRSGRKRNKHKCISNVFISGQWERKGKEKKRKSDRRWIFTMKITRGSCFRIGGRYIGAATKIVNQTVLEMERPGLITRSQDRIGCTLNGSKASYYDNVPKEKSSL